MVIVNISGNGIFCIYKCTINDCSYGAWLGIGHVDATAKRKVGSDCSLTHWYNICTDMVKCRISSNRSTNQSRA